MYKTFLGIICALTLIANVSATQYTSSTTTVEGLTTNYSGYGVDTDWFAMTGFTSAGSCGTAGGYVVLRIQDDIKGQRMFARVLNAKSAGTSLTVTVDDSYKDPSGYCYVRFIV